MVMNLLATKMIFCTFISREIFIKPDGFIAQEGDTIYQTRLADTLETIAAEGGDSFYTGSLSKQLLKDLRDIGKIAHCQARKPMIQL